MASIYRGIGKVRAHGRARIAITIEARDEQEFLNRWHKPAFDYPFEWENGHKFCIEYQVEDFAAEVGFYVDVLGITVDAISPSRAQFSSPDQQLVLAVAAIQPEQEICPPNNLRLQMFIKNLAATVTELERRGVLFEQPPESSSSDPDLLVATLQTPNGMSIELWGYKQISRVGRPAQPAQALTQPDDVDELHIFEQQEDDDEIEKSPADLPLFSSRPISIDDLEDELEEDGDEQTEAGRAARAPYSIDDDQLALGLGLLEEDQEESEGLYLDDEDARLDRFLKASARPVGYTFDERIEPVAPQKSDLAHSAPAAGKIAPVPGIGRSHATRSRHAPVNRKQRAGRTLRQPESPRVEPTYDDIDEQDQIP